MPNPPTARAQTVRWISVPRVWHYRKKCYIYRKDGKNFVFPIFCK